jgi:hypothetical protein
MIHKLSQISFFIAPFKELDLGILVDLVFGTVSFGTIYNFESKDFGMFPHFGLQLLDGFLHLLTSYTIGITKQKDNCLFILHYLLQLLILHLSSDCYSLVLHLLVNLEQLVGILNVV